MKTLKKFLENSSNPELFKKVFKAGQTDFKTIKEYPQDYYVANTGAVTGMIYYADTVKFAKKNHLQILQQLAAFENECGVLDKPQPTDETEYFNWLAWFAWEDMMSEMLNYLED